MVTIWTWRDWAVPEDLPAQFYSEVVCDKQFPDSAILHTTDHFGTATAACKEATAWCDANGVKVDRAVDAFSLPADVR